MTNHKQTRVLIVEDQAEARKLIHIAFRSPTFLVEEASTGYEALAMANESHPEVVGPSSFCVELDCLNS